MAHSTCNFNYNVAVCFKSKIATNTYWGLQTVQLKDCKINNPFLTPFVGLALSSVSTGATYEIVVLE